MSAEELEVSQKRHKVDELPEGIDIRSFTREAQWGSAVFRKKKVDAYKLIIDQMIYYGGLGAFFDRDMLLNSITLALSGTLNL